MRNLFLSLLAIISVAFAVPASANIIYDSQLVISAQGFGNAPRLLTLQTTNTESGCASYTGGTFGTVAAGTGTCIADGSVYNPNGYTNAGGDAVPGTNKTYYVTLGSLGISDAGQIVIIYNTSQTGSSPSTTIQDITLKFYDSAGNLQIAVDNYRDPTSGSQLYFAADHPGNGGAGFALVLDSTEASAVNSAFGGDLSNAVLTMEATITGSNDGPDTFAVNSRANVVPEPSSLALLGMGLAALALGLVGHRRRKNV